VLQVLFTAELNRRLAAAGIPIDAVCLHPGNVLTDVVRSLPPVIQKLYRALMTHILFTPQEGGPFQKLLAKIFGQQCLGRGNTFRGDKAVVELVLAQKRWREVCM